MQRRGSCRVRTDNDLVIVIIVIFVIIVIIVMVIVIMMVVVGIMMMLMVGIGHIPNLEHHVVKVDMMMMVMAAMMMMMVTQQIPTMTKSHHGGNLSLMGMVGFRHQHIPTIDNNNDEVANQVWLPMPTNLHCQQIDIYRFTTKKTKTSFINCCIETREYIFSSHTS